MERAFSEARSESNSSAAHTIRDRMKAELPK